MSYTLEKIQMINFKLFEDQTIQLDKNFSILTGPNGFGKSSIFDALEFLITGKIRRYDHYTETCIDRRNVIAEQCFIKRKGSDVNTKTYVEATFCSLSDSEELVTIRRTLGLQATGYDLKSELSIIHQNESKLLNKQEEEELAEKIGLKKNYNLFHYVEQDETTFQIKKKHKDRGDSVAHLFGMETQKARFEKFKKLKTVFQRVKTGIDQTLTNKESQLKGLTQQNDPNVSNEYFKLFKDVDTLWWDKPDVSIKDVETLASVKTLLDALTRVLNDETSVKHFFIVNSIDALLKDEDKLELIVDYAQYAPQLVSYNDIRTRYQSESQMRAFNTLKLPLDLGDEVTLQKLSALDHGEQLKNELNRLLIQRKSLNELSSALLTTSQLRQSLIEHQKENFTEHDTCPLCGYSWESVEKLQAQFDTSLEDLKGYQDTQTVEYENRLQQFFEEKVYPLQLVYTNKLSEVTPVSDEHFNNLTKFVHSYSQDRYTDLQNKILAPLGLTFESVNVGDFKNQLGEIRQAYPLPPSIQDDMRLIYHQDESLYNILFKTSVLPISNLIEGKKQYIQYWRHLTK